MSKEVDIIEGKVFEIKPDKRYILLFGTDMSQDGAQRLNDMIKEKFNSRAISVVLKNPKDVTIIEM